MLDIQTVPIQGDDLILEVSDDNGDNWYKIVCLIKQGFEFTRNPPKTNTQCGQLIGKGVPEMSIPIEGALNVVDDVLVDNAGYASYKKMQGWAKDFPALKARQLYPAGAGGDLTNRINCYLTDLKMDAPVDNIITFTGTLMGFGTWEIA